MSWNILTYEVHNQKLFYNFDTLTVYCSYLLHSYILNWLLPPTNELGLLIGFSPSSRILSLSLVQTSHHNFIFHLLNYYHTLHLLRFTPGALNLRWQRKQHILMRRVTAQ